MMNTFPSEPEDEFFYLTKNVFSWKIKTFPSLHSSQSRPATSPLTATTQTKDQIIHATPTWYEWIDENGWIS